MSPTEMLVNSPTPGQATPIAQITGNGGQISASASSFNIAAALPAVQQATGFQFRALIDQEIVLIQCEPGTTLSGVTRGVDGSTPAAHLDGALIFPVLTAGALQNLISQYSVQPSQLPQAVQLGAALAAGTAPMPTWVLEGWTLSQDFVLLSATRNANEVITTASVLWPDGSTGSFTTDTINPTFNTIDAFHVTYVWTVNGGGTHTITQAAVTRDASGAVIAQPNPTVV